MKQTKTQSNRATPWGNSKINFESREKDLSRFKISLTRYYVFANENMSLLLKPTLYVKQNIIRFRL